MRGSGLLRTVLSGLGVVASVGAAMQACSGDAGTSAAVVTDSAGVVIVESFNPQWSPTQSWHLSREPLVSIGVDDGADAYQLFRVRSAVRLDDGRIVVANGGTNELRFFDAAGDFQLSRGGEGEGPGEFRRLRSIWRHGDSLFLYDIGLARVTVYAASGEFGRVFRIEPTPDGMTPLPRGVLSSGCLLVQRSPPDNELGVGLYRPTYEYLRYNLDGEYVSSVGFFRGTEMYIGGQGDHKYAAVPPFRRSSYLLPFANRLYYGAGDAYEFEVWSTAGELEMVVRRPQSNPPVSAQEAGRFRDSIRERLPRMTAEFRALYSAMPLPDTKPAYGRVIVDAEGQLWAAEYGSETRWTVFDMDGRMLGAVEMPDGGTVLEIGSDYVLELARDELDVERVLLFQLIKP